MSVYKTKVDKSKEEQEELKGLLRALKKIVLKRQIQFEVEFDDYYILIEPDVEALAIRKDYCMAMRKYDQEPNRCHGAFGIAQIYNKLIVLPQNELDLFKLHVMALL